MVHRRGLTRRRLALGAGATVLASAGSAWAVEGEMTIGAANARVSLVEYASATCGHCAAFHASNWALLKSRYIDTGRVRFTMREMLTAPPVVSLAMFQLARCQTQRAPEYFRRLGILFERQHAILQTGTMVGVRDALVALGAQWGLNEEQVMAALNDQGGVDRVNRSIEDANQRGIDETPSFLLQGVRMTDPAFRAPDGMTRILDAALA